MTGPVRSTHTLPAPPRGSIAASRPISIVGRVASGDELAWIG